MNDQAKNKKSLIDIFEAISKTLTRIAMMVVKVTPVGVFAIAANDGRKCQNAILIG